MSMIRYQFPFYKDFVLVKKKSKENLSGNIIRDSFSQEKMSYVYNKAGVAYQSELTFSLL